MEAKKEYKFHILIVIRRPVGGIRTYIKYIYTHLDYKLYHFTILTQDILETKILQQDLSKLNVSYILNDNPSDFSLLKLVTKTILFNKFDLIHAHGFTAGVFSVLPSCLVKKKVILTLHEPFVGKQFKRVKSNIINKILSVILPLFNKIHFLSQDAKTNFLETFPRIKKTKNKCIVIKSGINTKLFESTKKRNLRKELNLSENTFLIGFLGRFTPEKGFSYLISALEIILNSSDLIKQPVVVAVGKGGYIREEKASIQKKGLVQHFKFLPFIPNIVSTLKGLDVVTMPSLWEGFPILAAEVMVAGVPLIASNCIGLREIIKNTPAVIVPVKDSNALAEALIHEIHISSRSKAETFREIATKRFDVKKQANELNKVILDACSN